MPLKVTRLQAAQVDLAWPVIHEGIQRSCDKSGGQLSSGYLWQECRGDRAFLYIVHDEAGTIIGASVFAYRDWTSGLRYVGLALCGTNAAEWFDLLHDMVRNDAKMGGAVGLIDAARPGMDRYYRKNKAIRKIQIVYEERL